MPKNVSLENKRFVPLPKLPKNVGNLGKIILATGFEKLPKVSKFRTNWSHCSRAWHLFLSSFLYFSVKTFSFISLPLSLSTADVKHYRFIWTYSSTPSSVAQNLIMLVKMLFKWAILDIFVLFSSLVFLLVRPSQDVFLLPLIIE